MKAKKEKTDYQVGIRTMYKRLKTSRRATEAADGMAQLWKQRHETLVLNATELERKFRALVADEETLRREIRILREQRASHPLRSVDPAAEVVMGMKRAMEFSINTSAALLDAMGELVDQVSGRKARRERDQELDLSHIEDPSR